MISCLRTLLALFLALLLLSACTLAPQQEVTYDPEATLSWFETVAALQEGTATPTTDWFPATATSTPLPTQAVTPTPQMLTGLGEVILEDDFRDADQWGLVQRETGTSALGNDQLTIALSAPRAYLSAQRLDTMLTSYYLEITASPNLCREGDSYGVLVRIQSDVDYARLVLNCSGYLRFERVHNAEVVVLQDWSPSGQVRPGAPISYRLGIWSLGSELRIFVDGIYQFSVEENTLLNGGVGVFARSVGQNAVSVSFSNLVIRSVSAP